MKVLIVAPARSTHTIKWVNSLSDKGIDIILFSLFTLKKGDYSSRVKVHSFWLPNIISKKLNGNLLKISYLIALPILFYIIKKYRPNIIHAHYASSYGLMVALIGVHPIIISVWGSDVFSFPKQSFFHERIFRYNLSRADLILSTSSFMKNEIERYTDKKIIVTPFGVDTEKFKPREVDSIYSREDIVIGTIKSLEKQYGIDCLIKSFKILKSYHPQLPLKLMIVGCGSEEKKLKNLTKELTLIDDVNFLGYINHSEIEKYYNMLKIYVAVSVIDDESFGVAILEAGACEKPVVVSDVGGLPEVVIKGITGLIVERNNPLETAKAIESLIFDERKCSEFGQAARKMIDLKYNWEKSVEQMISIYKSFNTQMENY